MATQLCDTNCHCWRLIIIVAIFADRDASASSRTWMWFAKSLRGRAQCQQAELRTLRPAADQVCPLLSSPRRRPGSQSSSSRPSSVGMQCDKVILCRSSASLPGRHSSPSRNRSPTSHQKRTKEEELRSRELLQYDRLVMPAPPHPVAQ